jgi:uncharacterized protein (TIGR02246 family)
MKRVPKQLSVRACATVAALCVVAAGCQTHRSNWQSEIDALENTVAVLDFAATYSEAFVSGDADAVAALMTEDFVALTPGKEPIVGRDAAREAIAADLAEMQVHSLSFVTREVEVHNSWAWAWGTSFASITPEGRETAVRLRGQFLWILQHGQDGNWLIARDCSHGGESE